MRFHVDTLEVELLDLASLNESRGRSELCGANCYLAGPWL